VILSLKQGIVKYGNDIHLKRSLGPYALNLLNNPSFEPFAPQSLRVISAASIESAISGLYLYSDVNSSTLRKSNSSFLIETDRPSNPCLCVSLHIPGIGLSGICTIVHHAEFQFPSAIYVHSDNNLIIYTDQEGERLNEYVQSQFFEQLYSVLRVAISHTQFEHFLSIPKSKALHFGLNKSFGHSHWNDVTGHLHLQYLGNKTDSKLASYHHLYGPNLWYDPLLFPRPARAITINSANETLPYCIKSQVSVFSPVGFSMTEKYVDFMSIQLQSGLNNMLAIKQTHNKIKKFHPIIVFNIRNEEWWRRSWKTVVQDLHLCANTILAKYPAACFVVDCLTSKFQSNQYTKSESSSITKLLVNSLSSSLPSSRIFNIDGKSLPEKISYYRLVDLAICQFGSGSLIPDFVYSIPSINITAETDLIHTYSSPTVITRQCKPVLRNTELHGVFLSAEYIELSNEGFSVNSYALAKLAINILKNSLSIPRSC
tara:strand:+ start:377 stop:1831 length:1455 start_codon:yes stop_codon:yes gene_type:complete